jgi:hypothetical protein
VETANEAAVGAFLGTLFESLSRKHALLDRLNSDGPNPDPTEIAGESGCLTLPNLEETTATTNI